MWLLKSTMCFILFLVVGSNRHNTFNNGAFNHFQQKITNSEYVYACVKPDKIEELQKCQKIEEFSISNNISFTCFDEYLPINFEIDFQLKNTSFVKYLTYGYLSPIQGISIHNKQLRTNTCKKIKK